MPIQVTILVVLVPNMYMKVTNVFLLVLKVMDLMITTNVLNV